MSKYDWGGVVAALEAGDSGVVVSALFVKTDAALVLVRERTLPGVTGMYRSEFCENDDMIEVVDEAFDRTEFRDQVQTRRRRDRTKATKVHSVKGDTNFGSMRVVSPGCMQAM